MIFTIFKKELKETLRDRRTLIVMIVIPVLLFPIIFKITTSFSHSMNEKAATKKLVVGYVGENELLTDLKLGNYEWKKFEDTIKIQKEIQDGNLDLGLYFEPDFDNAISENKSAKVKIIHDATDIGYKERIEQQIQVFNQKITQKRLDSLKIDKQLFSAIEVSDSNVASPQEMIGKLAGGMLPYIFIIFGFLGCMYPAIDLFTGEKERGTVETLLTTPVPRWKILAGKMGVVVLSGLIAATFALGGLLFSTKSLPAGKGMGEFMVVIDAIFSAKTLIPMFSLIIPLMIFFAGLIIPIAVYAKSFKEAQSIVTPLNIVVLIPAMIGMFPGIEYSVETAFIPVVNVVLATKEIIAGTINYGLFAGTFISLLAFAVLSVLLSYRQFGKENNISSN